MGSIVLRVSELKKLVGMLSKDHMDFVKITLLDGDAGEELQPSAAFTGVRSACPWELVDYDEIEAAPSEVDFFE